MRIIDVSDAHKPVLLGHFYDSVIRRMAVVDVTVRDHKAYLADLDNGLYIVDVNDPRQPALLAHYHTANAHSVDLAGNLAIVADGVYGLLAIDVSDPMRPQRLASLELSGFCADVQVVDGLAYVAGYYDGLHVVDVRDPGNPVPIDHFQQGVYWDDAAWDNIACYQSVDVAGDYVYVTEYYSGMLVLRRNSTKK